MRTRLTCWLDKERMVPVYGIKVFVGATWANVAAEGKPMLFDDQKDAEAERSILEQAEPTTGGDPK